MSRVRRETKLRIEGLEDRLLLSGVPGTEYGYHEDIEGQWVKRRPGVFEFISDEGQRLSKVRKIKCSNEQFVWRVRVFGHVVGTARARAQSFRKAERLLVAQEPLDSVVPKVAPSSDRSPRRLLYNRDERRRTQSQWSKVYVVKGSDRALIFDILTTFRKHSPKFWKLWKGKVQGINLTSMDVWGAAWKGHVLLGLRAFGRDGKLISNRSGILQGLTHEAFHILGGALDCGYGIRGKDFRFQGAPAGKTREIEADVRSLNLLNAIALSGGWHEIYGGDKTYVFLEDNRGFRVIDQTDETFVVEYYRFDPLVWKKTRDYYFICDRCGEYPYLNKQIIKQQAIVLEGKGISTAAR